MIVNWIKYERGAIQSSDKSIKNTHSHKSGRSSKSNSRSFGKDKPYTSDQLPHVKMNRKSQEDSNTVLGDLFQEKNSSITSANSLHNNFIEPKDKESNDFFTEIDMSEINDYKELEEEDFFISHIESSINFFDWRNNHFGQSQPSPQANSQNETLNKTFLQMISNKKSFTSFLNLIDQNPNNFLQIYFSIMINNFQDIIFNNTSYVLFIKLFPYFSKYHKEIFFNKIIKSYFSLLSHNQYGVEVLNQFTLWILNDSILVSIVNIVQSNLTDLASDENGCLVIMNLLNQRNAFISKIIYDAIVINILVIALNSNGVKVIINLMTFSNCSQRLIEAILKNLNKLLLHSNGHLLVIYLLKLQANCISSFIINYLTTNISLFASDENGGKVIDECFTHCNETILFPLINAFCSKKVVRKLCSRKNGLNVLMKVVDCSPQPTKIFLLNQIKAETKKE